MNSILQAIVLIFFTTTVYSATLSVTTGPTLGLTTIFITAEAPEVFGTSPVVFIGENEATIVSFGSGSIQIQTPPGVGTNLPVIINSSTGSITAGSTFSYDAPVLSSISPELFYSRGGETGTLTGSNFGTGTLGEAMVLVGNTQAQVISQDHSAVTIRLPAGVGINKAVRLKVGGQISDTLYIDYRAPEIWGITPDRINPGPGDTIIIDGVNFGNGFQLPVVRVGNVPCSEVVFAGDNRLYAITGIGTPQDLNVTVSIGGQTSAPFILKNKKPEIFSLSNPSWSTSGGDVINVFGKHLGSDITKIFLNSNGTSITPTSLAGNSIEFISPPGIGKNLPLSASVNGEISESIFHDYEESILTSVMPNTGNVIGGLPITVGGPGIGSGAQAPKVFFGDKEGANVIVVDPNTISCTLPAGVGQVEVSLELNGQTSTSLPFTYSTPQIFSVNPLVNSYEGGEVVVSGIELGNEIQDAMIIVDGEAYLAKSVSYGAVVFDLPPGFGANKSIQLKVGNQLSNLLNFSYVSPAIASISPTSGLPGEVMIIDGANLGGQTIPTQVTIGGQAAGILSKSNTKVRCLIPVGTGSNLDVEVSVGNTSDTYVGFTYDQQPMTSPENVEIAGQLKITNLPFRASNGVLLSVDEQGNVSRNTAPQISVSITNDTLFLGSGQYLIIPGISKANGGK